MDEMTIGYGLLLVALGLVAGVINTLAGGGSNLTIPALMISGMPPDVANATNRVDVMMQSKALGKRLALGWLYSLRVSTVVLFKQA